MEAEFGTSGPMDFSICDVVLSRTGFESVAMTSPGVLALDDTSPCSSLDGNGEAV